MENQENIILSEAVQRAISDMGFEELSPIQKQAIPLLLEGRDVIGQAQTGTGKTAAFGIPIVETVDPTSKAVQAVCLCPTRELCIQVAEEVSKLAKYKKGIYTLPIYGGQPIERQFRGLQKGVQIVIGTPGRVIDHINRGTLRLDQVKIFILDEADEMFDMGFRDDIDKVMQHLPEERQTTFFSATMAPDIMDFAKQRQKDPEIVKIVKKEMTVPKVDQFYYDLQNHMKPEILSRVLDIYNPKLTVVFCNTKKMVDDCTANLQAKGYFADGLHGDLNQYQRDTVMGKFRQGTIDVLVATDVAARGIDVDDVDLVINYDLPQDDEYYVHRIGRTARAGRTGTALSFVTGRDAYRLRDIQKYTKTKIDRKPLPTLKDIEKNQLGKLKSMIIDQVETGDLTSADPVFNLLLDSDYNPSDIARAMISLYIKEKRYDGHVELDYVDNDKVMPRKREADRFRRDREGFKGKKDKFRRKNMTRVFVNIGSSLGISQRHILASFIQETGIHKRDVGAIDIYDKFTYVEVPKNQAQDIARKMNGKLIKGFQVNAEIARPRKYNS